ncbi:MAG TPA: type II toxin-antitoxin system antitoxin SocA domain-containing protein [Bryobacteraceae bacterium]|nr:type II toxin-antitoxin system antitoxin SocA domain-containing protein [Bryobacteraceae bacterium]
MTLVSPAVIPARRVADVILSAARDREMEITNLKLQKLLYYSQAWYLVFEDSPLFSERLEAWVHGPVVPNVFGEFKSYRWNAIDTAVAIEDVDPEIVGHVCEVMDAYGKFTATQLERLTHSEEPWKEARGGLPQDEPSRNVINLATMKRFYSAALGDGQRSLSDGQR